MRAMRPMLLTVVAGALVLAGLQPAAAATTPGATGMVSFTAASYSRSSASAGLTVDWNPVRGAKRYQVFLSRHYSMSNARTYGTSNTTKTIKGLSRGADYFVQVRGVNGSKVGSKSKRVGHTTIRRQELASGPQYRVMTYNLCTDKCSGWSKRAPAAAERISHFQPDVVAAQEANQLATPPGYSLAVFKSAKRLLYKTSRFEPPVTAPRAPARPAPTADGCDDTYTNGRTGWVFLGYHGSPGAKGCRYAVWAELVDKTTGDRTVFVDVHTVSGDSDYRADNRKAEITTLTRHISSINPERLPVVYAGDFNSHKNRSNDYLRTVMHRAGYYDAYDLAMRLYRQHFNSYNDFSVTPKVSYKWGDHVDHVWIRPDRGRILGWYNGALYSHGRMATPIPSDHSPLVIDLRLN